MVLLNFTNVSAYIPLKHIDELQPCSKYVVKGGLIAATMLMKYDLINDQLLIIAIWFELQ